MSDAQFCKHVGQLYGTSVITPNMHVSCYLKCVLCYIVNYNCTELLDHVMLFAENHYYY